MDKKSIDEFFDNEVLDYLPYRDSNLYKSLMTTIRDHYFDDLYNNIPTIFKQMYEASEIPSQISDEILIQIGITQQLINELNHWQKNQIISYLPDIQQKKGSVNLLKQIVQVFDNTISIYELYLNRRDNEWVFLPHPLYIDPLAEKITNTFSFFNIYNRTLSFFLSYDYLENLYKNNYVLTPLKTNLLLIDFTHTSSISIVEDLTVGYFLFEYGDTPITLEFEDRVFNLNIRLITYVWFYLVTKYFDYTWMTFPRNRLLHYNSNQSMFPHNEHSLKEFLNDYDNFALDTDNSRQQLDELYFAHYLNKYSSFRRQDEIVYADTMFAYIADRNRPFANYLEQQIDSNVYIEEIISHMYNSIYEKISLSDDDLYKRCGLDWLNYLPKINLNLEDTAEYKLINETKPAHVELVQSYFTGINVDDKFNSFPMDVYDYEIDFGAGPGVSSFVMSDTYEFIEED